MNPEREIVVAGCAFCTDEPIDRQHFVASFVRCVSDTCCDRELQYL
jgi:hypothetical protein